MSTQDPKGAADFLRRWAQDHPDIFTRERTANAQECALAVTEALDAAWGELRKIRERIGANPEESTLDEVDRVLSQYRRESEAGRENAERITAIVIALEGIVQLARCR